jgi:hypothetical protein
MRLAIGDIHGRDFWKALLEEEASEYYFTGDYFDSFNVSFKRQYENFRELCRAARNDQRIKLCLGNHDYQYLRDIPFQRYSGFQERRYSKIQSVLEENMDLVQIVYDTPDYYLISHAGVSQTFMKRFDLNTVADINGLFLTDRDFLAFDNTSDDPYGESVTQGPLWIRPASLEEDCLPRYSQIAGHTEMDEIAEVSLPDNRKLIFIDTGGSGSAFRV